MKHCFCWNKNIHYTVRFIPSKRLPVWKTKNGLKTECCSIIWIKSHILDGAFWLVFESTSALHWNSFWEINNLDSKVSIIAENITDYMFPAFLQGYFISVLLDDRKFPAQHDSLYYTRNLIISYWIYWFCVQCIILIFEPYNFEELFCSVNSYTLSMQKLFIAVFDITKKTYFFTFLSKTSLNIMKLSTPLDGQC